MQLFTPTIPELIPPSSQLSIQDMLSQIQISSNSQVAMPQQHSMQLNQLTTDLGEIKTSVIDLRNYVVLNQDQVQELTS